MSRVTSSSSSSGIGLFSLLGIVFIVLKLLEVINWSWWFVLMPLYLPAVLVLGFAGVLLVLAFKS